ncbi:MAG: hypothetical protein HYZ53_13280 [Planctomycetes bacterium]|nr:hypothetical protein [Planctomycetota bacterium]
MKGERRALTNWRGAVDVRGDRDSFALMRRAMGAPQDYDPRRLTHGFHVYPARLHPHLAETLLASARPRQAVLDPFCGSGTVLVQALARGCRALGRDINPLAVRIARLKTSLWSADELAALEAAAEEVGDRARELLASRSQSPPPASARQDFDPHMAWEMSGLRDAIRQQKNPRIKEALLLGLSSILVKVSRREGLTTDRHMEKHIPPGRGIRHYADRLRELGEMLGELARAVPAGTAAADVAEGDARLLEGIPDGSVDLVLTSPPYAGTYSYVDCSAMSYAWLDMRPGDAARREIGAKEAKGGLASYRRDMRATLAAVRRVLSPNGRAFFVVADLEEGTEIRPADRMLEQLGREVGLSMVAIASQPRSVFGRKGVPRVAGGKLEHMVQLKHARGFVPGLSAAPTAATLDAHENEATPADAPKAATGATPSPAEARPVHAAHAPHVPPKPRPATHAKPQPARPPAPALPMPRPGPPKQGAPRAGPHRPTGPRHPPPRERRR